MVKQVSKGRSLEEQAGVAQRLDRQAVTTLGLNPAPLRHSHQSPPTPHRGQTGPGPSSPITQPAPSGPTGASLT
ncbi:hypothetical protein SRHO_G00134540 [Serrasalmus rhombeus]